MGLVDHTVPGSGALLDTRMRDLVKSLLSSNEKLAPGYWKSSVDITPAGLVHTRAEELGEMSKDFWSPRSQSAGDLDEEESDDVDDVLSFERKARAALMAELLKEYMESMLMTTLPQRSDANHGSAPHHSRRASENVGNRDLRPIFSCYYDVTAITAT
ncbi:hypothetical protein R1flu_014342 [Riccia fluitans]|uniref:Uncharacterized protein n=1 Tax=Riccia fluitans TaxID=41844 RepID=A0ABD1YFU4_9MARC